MIFSAKQFLTTLHQLCIVVLFATLGPFTVPFSMTHNTDHLKYWLYLQTREICHRNQLQYSASVSS